MNGNDNWRKYECINNIAAWICTTIGILCGLYLTRSANLFMGVLDSVYLYNYVIGAKCLM